MSAKLFVIVATFDFATGKEIDRRTIEYSRSRARAWLDRHMFHSFNNGKGVQIFNADDEATESKLSEPSDNGYENVPHLTPAGFKEAVKNYAEKSEAIIKTVVEQEIGRLSRRAGGGLF